jgi:predicted transcriptional regulator
MAKKLKHRPTEGELAILRVLWREGRCTVRDVHEALGGKKRSVYTTTLKLMQIMTDKGLVRRDESRHAHVYEAAVSREQAQRKLLRDLLSQAFDGSVHKLVVQALSAGEVSPEELRRIRRLIDQQGRPRDDTD